MSATVTKFPVVPRPIAIRDLEDVALPGLRLPRRVYGRLLRVAKDWDLEASATAETLLIGAINEAVGVKR